MYRYGLRRRIVKTIVLLAAAMMPLFLVVAVVYEESRRQAASEAAITAETIRRQVEAVLYRAEDQVAQISGLLGRPCRDVIGDLAPRVSMQPYLRGLALLKGNQIYCGDLGSENIPLSDVVPAARLPLSPGLSVIGVTGTRRFPDRPGIVVAQTRSDGDTALAFVDGQYLADLQRAAAYNSLYDVKILAGQDRLLVADRDPQGSQSTEQQEPRVRQVSQSDRFPLEVSVAVQDGDLSVYSRELWRGYLPFLALACLLCAYAAHLVYSRRMSLAAEIRRGMGRGEFHMVYQPVVDLKTRQLSGVEALLRWTRPHYGPMRPDLFIPVAEEAGEIIPLTRHVFQLIAADLPALKLPAGVKLGINVAGAHVGDKRFMDDFRNLMRLVGPDGPVIVLELTERDTLPDSDLATAHLAQVRAERGLWAIDDFGTGHSSLAYLQRLEVDFIKIDRTFVAGVGQGAVSGVVLESVIELAHKLNLALIAEGIETEEQAAFLAARGVQWGQGYLFAKPMAPDDLARWRAETDAGRAPLQPK